MNVTEQQVRSFFTETLAKINEEKAGLSEDTAYNRGMLQQLCAEEKFLNALSAIRYRAAIANLYTAARNAPLSNSAQSYDGVSEGRLRVSQRYTEMYLNFTIPLMPKEDSTPVFQTKRRSRSRDTALPNPVLSLTTVR